MTKHEKAVRDAAAALHDAIVAAHKAGLRIEWPTSPEGLASIAISETAKAEADATIVVVAKGVELGSAEHKRAEQAAQKAVNDTGATK